MQSNLAVVEKNRVSSLPKETLAVLEILEQIDNHTINLRNKLMEELKSSTNSVRLKLENI